MIDKALNEMSHEEVVRLRPDMIEREISLEEEAADIGVSRVLKSIDQKGYATGSRSGSRILRESTLKTADALRSWIEGREKLNRKHPMLDHVRALDVDQLAFIVSRIMVDNAAKERTAYTTVCVAVGRRVQQVTDYGVFREANEGLAVKLERQLASSTSAGHRRAVLSKAFKSANFEGVAWDEKAHAMVGHILVSAFNDASGLFERVVITSKKKALAYCVPTEALNDLLASGEISDALTMPYHYPMIVPPKDWTSVYEGGYLDGQLHGMDLVKTKGDNLATLDSADMPDVLDAINLIQATPWRVNAKVLKVLDFLNELGGGVAGLTSSVIPELPVKPWGDLDDAEWETYRTDPANEKAVKDYKRDAAMIYQARVKWTSKRLVQKQQVAVAERFKDEEAIYFPHTADYRGRIYPCAGLGSMNPQGNDAGKALLEFSRGKALGDSGAGWLAVHCANVWGNDKVSMDDRILWAHINSDMMTACAANPLSRNEWMDADKPLQFLAACHEWAGYKAEGSEWVSHLPIALDGSCSGMQHFAAMVRDVASAKAVNVLQVGDVPEDLYTKVLGNVLSALPEGSEWSSRLSRKIVKQPCMTTPYGVTLKGIRDQITNWTKRGISEGSIQPFSGDLQESCTELAPVVERAIQGTVGAAGDVMGWLKDVARITSKAGFPISWTTPNGFRVSQDYRKNVSSRVKVSWEGKVTQLTLLSGTRVLDTGGQVRGIAPNFVHSFDACHLQVTTANCAEYGLKDFAMIHDSFAVHACDTQLLSEVLRECFIAIYSEDTLGNFMLELEQQLPVELFSELPAPPTMGSLDINCVRDSEFFFA